MERIKILFTSVGRRVELMSAFHAAADRLGIALEIWGIDIDETAPALLYCDRTAPICRIKDPNYIPSLLALCEKEKINALIPMIDTDLLLLSQNQHLFDKVGTKVLISAEDKIQLCRDKRYTATYFHSVGLESPSPVDNYIAYRGGYPAFIKPKNGSSSRGAQKVQSFEELKMYSGQVEDYIVQPFVSGVEYTVDVFCDWDGLPIYITPRIRQAVRSGEVLKTTIVHDAKIVEEIKTLVADYKPCGAMTVQLIRDDATGIDYFIEINPRFGGGAPISIAAGADSCVATLRLLRGERLNYEPSAAAENAVYYRYDQSACIHSGDAKVKAIIFDLDDTLFSEKEYVKSGYRVVAASLPQLPDAYDKLCLAFEEGKLAIDAVLAEAGLYTEVLAQRCLTKYRSHAPTISLYPGVAHTLRALRERGIKLGIITDGRPEGQRKKIDALGLNDLVDEIIVTDELGGPLFRKPCDIAFRIMQRKLGVPFGSMVYVADNPVKDFAAPCQLSMQTIWFDNPDCLYPVPDGARIPDRRITAIAEIAELVK